MEEEVKKEIVKVEAATKLTSEEEKEIKDKVEEMLGCEIDLEIEVNPDLIGGLKLNIRSTILDISLKSALEKVKQDLIAS